MMNIYMNRREREIISIIAADSWMMDVLRAARRLNLPDWMIGAGFVRGKVWDILHGHKTPTRLDDIDLIYFDKSDLSEQQEKRCEEVLGEILSVNWSVKNQARMHVVTGDSPYKSSEDALAHWVETPTCVAIKLEEDDKLKLIAPLGVDDLVNLVVRKNPLFPRDPETFRHRVATKEWTTKWPKLRVID